MGVAELISLGAVGMTLAGLAGRAVWLLSQILTSMKTLTSKVNRTHELITEHQHDCDRDRVRLNTTIDDHDRRITHLEST